jgi:hypothetical protein
MLYGLGLIFYSTNYEENDKSVLEGITLIRDKI